MEIKVRVGNIADFEGDTLVVPHFQSSGQPEPELATIDGQMEGAIGKLVGQGEVTGKLKEMTVIYTLGRLQVAKLVVLGLGKRDELTAERIRVATAEVCRFLRQKNGQIIGLVLPQVAGISARDLAQAAAEGAVLGSYTFKKHMTKPQETKDIKSITVLMAQQIVGREVEEGVARGRITAEATALARDMINEPPNRFTPAEMADVARRVAAERGIKVKVLEKPDFETLGMGGLLGVSQGSQQPARFIELRYQGRGSDEIDIALVGKGITFDSGGISLKPAEGMGDMKGDMAGGAIVIAAISAIAQLKARVNVVALIPATENLPSGTALKPGDIIRTMDGKTVEIISTDAEGRLILADALSYAKKMGAKRLVDIATLTGSCRAALGDICSGVFGNNQQLVDQVVTASKEAGECVWQMPMNNEYRELNKSDVADIKNTGGRNAGAITAAWFLGEFAGDTPWVHLDIAGTSLCDKDQGYRVKGATGVHVRTFVNLALSLGEGQSEKSR